MQRLKLALAALLVLPLLALGCTGPAERANEHGTAGTAAQQQHTGTTSADGNQIALGKSLSADGEVSGGGEAFQAGDPVFASLQADKLPAGANVTLSWIGPQGAPVSTEEMVVPPDARVITLSAKDTSGWQPGNYRLEVAAGGSTVASKAFTIGEGAPAD